MRLGMMLALMGSILFVMLPACGGDWDEEENLLTLNGKIRGYLLGEVLEGVQLCARDRDGIACTSTDAEGAYSWTGIPVQTRLQALVTKDGYVSMMVPIETRQVDISLPGLSMFTPPEVDLLATSIGLDVVAGQGVVFYLSQVSDSLTADGTIGVAIALTPASGDGPFYNDVDGNIDLGLTGTHRNGLGGFLNVAPGLYTLTATPPGGECTPLYGWSTGVTNTLEVDVLADTITTPVHVCPPN